MGPSPESDGNSSGEIPRSCGDVDGMLRAEPRKWKLMGKASSNSFGSVLLFATSARTLGPLELASGLPEVCCTSPLAWLRTRLTM